MDIRFVLGDAIEDLAIKFNKGVSRIRFYRYRALEKKGADFAGRIMQEDLGFTPKEGNDYTASWGYIRRLFYNRITENDSIIDLGCGKGYAMYIMGKFKFRNIFGLEISDKLCDIANKNIKLLYRGDSRFKIFNADATQILKNERVTDAIKQCNYIYIYNSFPSNVMKIVISELIYLIEKAKCKYTIFYASPSPDCLEMIQNDAHFVFVKEYFSNTYASIYEFETK